MKKISLLFKITVVLILLVSSANCIAQLITSPLDYSTNNLDQFRNSRDKFNYESSYFINGQTVLGSPFFDDSWLPGSITTKDGRTFDNYKLKYDILKQALFFNSGNDSLEVNDEINEFTLKDNTSTFHFVNAQGVNSKKLPGYYQVALDDSAGQLLIYNKKIVADEAFGIPLFRGKKHFEPETYFYFYNKSTKKNDKIKFKWLQPQFYIRDYE